MFVLVSAAMWETNALAASGRLSLSRPANIPQNERIVYEKDSLYYHIVVSEDAAQRYLRFRSRGIQSCMLLADPQQLRLEYVRMMMLGIAYAPPQPKRILMMGLGGGSIPKFLLKAFPEVQIDVIELDPEVADVARRFFQVPKDPRLKITVMDGRVFLTRSRDKYDIIFLDAYNDDSIPFHLCTLEFVQIVKKALNPGGVAVSNIWAPELNKFYYSEIRTYLSAFQELYLLEGQESGNIIFILPLEPRKLAPEALARLTAQFDAQRRLPLPLTPFAARTKLITQPPTNAPLLTDDYAPVNVLKQQKVK